MPTPYQIPLQTSPQIASITLAGVQYQLTLKWNDQNSSWTLDMADSSGAPIISGIPLVTGADLLEQFGYLKFGGKLFAQTQGGTDDVPNFTNLGAGGNLYFVVEP